MDQDTYVKYENLSIPINKRARQFSAEIRLTSMIC